MKPEQLNDILNQMLQYFEGYASEFEGVEGDTEIYEINGKEFHLFPEQYELFLTIKNNLKMNNR